MGTKDESGLLQEANVVLIERVVHATRTVIRQCRVEITPFREGQLVRALYEDIVRSGRTRATYEEVLGFVEEAFKVSKAKAEAWAAEDWWEGAHEQSWDTDDGVKRRLSACSRFWPWLEERRVAVVWFLILAAVIVTILIGQMLLGRYE